MNIELRDYFAAQLVSGNVDKYYDAARRKLVAKGIDKKDDEWIHLTSEEATQERIEKAAKMAYRIADEMIKARE